jgi:hypothetical protein
MNKITINGIELELTDKQVAGLVEQHQAKQGDFPQHGELYHFVDSSGGISCIHFSGDIFDKWRKSIGNCFRTREEAEHYRDYLVALNTLKKSSDFVPDWDCNQTKYAVISVGGKLQIDWWVNYNCSLPCYYRTKDDAKSALSKYRREFEIVYGIAK